MGAGPFQTVGARPGDKRGPVPFKATSDGMILIVSFVLISCTNTLLVGDKVLAH